MFASPISGKLAFSYHVPLLDLESSLSNAVRLSSKWKKDGIDCIEISLSHYIGSLAEFNSAKGHILSQKMKEIQNEGINVWSVHIPFGLYLDLSTPSESDRQEIVSYYRRVMESSCEGGASVAVAHPSAEPITDSEREKHIEQCRKSIMDLTKSELPIALAIECLPRTCLCSTASETSRILEDTNAYLCMDVNHPHHESAQSFIRQLGKKLITVHISDDDGIDEKHWMPGKGVIEFDQVLQALADIGYIGPFLYEVAPPNGVENAGLDFSFNYQSLIERYYSTERT